MFVNLFVKNDKWVKDNKVAFALFDDFGVGVAVISPEMEILALNKVMKKWFPEVDVNKKPVCYTCFNNPPRNEKCSYCPTAKTLKDGKVHEAVTETPRFDRIVNFRVVSSPVKDKDGNIIAAIEVVEDVTEHKRLDEERANTEKKYRSLVEKLPAVTYIASLDKDSRTLFISPQIKDLLGFTPEEYYKSEAEIWLKQLYPEDRDKVIAELEKCHKSMSSFRVDYRMARKDGRVIWVTDEASVIKDESGKPLFLQGVMFDITKRKRTEEILKEIEKQQEALLDNIPDIAWLKDKESRFIAVNEPFSRACGVAPKDLVGKNDFDIWPRNLSESYRADDAEVIRTGRRKIIEEPMHNKDGKVQWIETIKTPIFNEKGEVIGTTGIARDITVRKKLEFQLKESEEKFRRIFESANDAIFIADLRTGEILDVNKAAENLIGRPRKELVGVNQTKLHPSEESESYKEKFYSMTSDAQEMKNSLNPSLEAEIFNSRGERVPVYISVSVFEIGGRKVAQGIFRDISELKRIEREKKEAEALALIDPHTQLYNYRYLQRRLHSEFELSKRRATPLSILMVDIDYFKSVNDTYGHEYGDTVLQEFAIVLQHASRGIDIVTRFEGEGFAIILPDTEEKGALAFADRIQRIMKKHRFGASKVKLRISIGICSYPEDGIATVDQLLTTADKCVRLAKEQGGDTISVSSQLRKKKTAPIPVDPDSQKRVNNITNKFVDLLRRNRLNTIEAVYALAHTVGAKNAYTEEHSEEMVKLSTEVGKKMNLTDQELDDLKHGAMLHDIGKLGVSEKILLKRGKLTKKEFEVIKKHPQIGADIIRPVHFLKDVVPIILHHHERYDGYGYGSKLKGDEIPIGARIIAVVDVYQALVSNRPYRKAYSKREALKIIREESGTHFDPKIVAIFMEIVTKEKKAKK
ncbi:MAG: PAS domain S-box protein [Candidatus Omnitrophota bacterium]|jgi:diguanylate cyclase (GGDEF)-like protein/PAS domain S-box-containing protein/putative nucleotidyltransferase with HDIG domain